MTRPDKRPRRLRAIVDLPGEWTREAYEAQVARAEAMPANSPHRESAIEGARRNLSIFEAGEREPTPRQQVLIERLLHRLAERSSGS